MKLRQAPYWYDRFPRSRRPAFPRQRNTHVTRVAIVGGGLTGCSCAYAFASAGIPVVLLEADEIGSAATAAAPGVVREDFDTPFSAATAQYGLRTTRPLWEGIGRASRELAAVLRRRRVQCQLIPQDLLTVAGAGEATRQLRREHDARRQAGIAGTWMTASRVLSEAALPVGGAIKTHAFVIDPYRACLGLAAHAVENGAAIFERSEARRIHVRPRYIEIATASGAVHADAVVVAGASGIPDLRPLKRHVRPRHAYAVVTEPLPAAIRRETGRRTSVLMDDAAPPHLVRWLADDRVLITGADQDPPAPRAQEAALVQRAGQLMYELSLLYPAISGLRAEWAWSYAFEDAADGLPYIGPHRNFPRHLFALGLGRHGAGASWLAGRVLLRHFAGKPAKGDDHFGFPRILRS
jgi:glycine/D-amino acid oxidase-like deaminating enzyme